MQVSIPKKLSYETFEQKDIWDIDTWPYGPEGIVTKELPFFDKKVLLEDQEKTEKVELQQIDDFVERFSEKQREAIGWILAAIIGVLGEPSN